MASSNPQPTLVRLATIKQNSLRDKTKRKTRLQTSDLIRQLHNQAQHKSHIDELLKRETAKDDGGLQQTSEAVPTVRFIGEDNTILETAKPIEEALDQTVTAEDPGCWGDEGVCERFMRATRLKHFALVIIVSIYAFVGAAIFNAIEGPMEQRIKAERHNRSHNAIQEMSANISQILMSEGCESQLVAAAMPAIQRVLKNYQEKEELLPTNESNWDLWGSMFYAGTLFTTIGYGHYAPATNLGRLVTMLYSLIGIPLVLAMLSDLGNLLSEIVDPPWNHVRAKSIKLANALKKKLCKHHSGADKGGTTSPSREPLTQNLSPTVAEQGITSTSSEDNDDSEPNDETQFRLPIPVALIFLVLWILFCGALFCIWETEWTYFKSVYFFFISLTTIGLGDVVPDHPKYMIMAFPLVLMGLSLISLVLNLIQDKVADIKSDTGQYVERKIGWVVIEEDNTAEEKDLGGWKNDSNLAAKLGDNGPTPATVAHDSSGENNTRPKSRETSPNRAILGIMKVGSKPPAAETKEDSHPHAKAKKWLQQWASHVNILHQRGVQTNETYITSMKEELQRRYPGASIAEILPKIRIDLPTKIAAKSKDDISGLISEMDSELSTDSGYNRTIPKV